MRPLICALLLAFSASAAAQLRTIPEDAKRGMMRHVQEMEVEIDGAHQRLAPGAQIRNPANTIILPTAIPSGSPVKYQVDATGMVNRVWILSPQEAEQSAER
jgi:hypothetical protein